MRSVCIYSPSEGGGWQGLFGHCPIALFCTSSSSAHLVGVGEGMVLATAELTLFPLAYREAFALYVALSKRLFGRPHNHRREHLRKAQNSLLPYAPTGS